MTFAVQQRTSLSNTSSPRPVVQPVDQVLPEIVPVLKRVSISTRTKRRVKMPAIVKVIFPHPSRFAHTLSYNTFVVILSILYICCIASLISLPIISLRHFLHRTQLFIVGTVALRHHEEAASSQHKAAAAQHFRVLPRLGRDTAAVRSRENE